MSSPGGVTPPTAAHDTLWLPAAARARSVASGGAMAATPDGTDGTLPVRDPRRPCGGCFDLSRAAATTAAIQRNAGLPRMVGGIFQRASGFDVQRLFFDPDCADCLGPCHSVDCADCLDPATQSARGPISSIGPRDKSACVSSALPGWLRPSSAVQVSSTACRRPDGIGGKAAEAGSAGGTLADAFAAAVSAPQEPQQQGATSPHTTLPGAARLFCLPSSLLPLCGLQ